MAPAQFRTRHPGLGPPLWELSVRDNPQFKALKKALGSSAAYRQLGWIWLEGDHLCQAARQRGATVRQWVVSERFFEQKSTVVHDFAGFVATQNVANDLTPGTLLPHALMQQLCTQDDRALIAAQVVLPIASALQPKAASLVLDRVQDSGNVGTLLRLAAAFGYHQVLALQGTAALYSPKVLRAAMGAHFGLQLHEGLSASDVSTLKTPVLATSSHQGEWLHQATLPWPHSWLMGNEGQGLSAELQALATQHIRIAQPGGEESLNVATAAAICMHAGAVGNAPR
jgi:RNA methyltransferase, TrmH family